MRRLFASLILFLAAYAAGVVLLLIIFHWQFGFLGYIHFYSAFVRPGFWASAFVLVLLLCPRHRHWLADAAIFATVCMFASFTAELAYMLFLEGRGWLQDPSLPANATPMLRTLLAALAAVEAPAAVIMPAAMVGRLLATNEEDRVRSLRVNMLETRLAEARLQLLQSQIQPHFLFNSLNSVATLIRRDAPRAEEMLELLARFYSIAAATEGRQFVTLTEEIGFMREYFSIEQIRFGARLRYAFVIGDGLSSAEVPALILQPLAENAIKHGVARVPGRASVTLQAVAREGRLLIAIENLSLDGDLGSQTGGGACPPQEATPEHRGVGLANTRQRLEQLFGARFALVIEPVDGGMRVRLDIPLRMADEVTS